MSFRRHISRRRRYDFKIRTLHFPQFLMQHRDTFVRGEGDRPVDAVIGIEHAVPLQCDKYRSHLGRELGSVEIHPQPEANYLPDHPV